MKKHRYHQALVDRMGVSVVQSQVYAGSIRTAYLSAGKGESVVLLHGAGAGGVTWYPNVAEISKHFQVFVPDIVGYGESDKPNAPYDRAYFVAWLKDFMSALKISKAHIVGLSQGGAIALEFAVQHTDMLERLVLVNSAAFGAKVSLMPFFGMVWLNVFPSLAANRFYSRYLLFDTKNRDPNHEKYSVEVIKSQGGQNAFQQGRGAAVSPMPRELLGNIKNDTLILCGQNDQLFNVKHSEEATGLLSKAQFMVLPHAGHLIHMDQPTLFSKTVIDFLLKPTIQSA